MFKRKDGSANRGAAVYAYGKNTDFGASIKIVTNLQKIFKKVVQTADFLIYYLRYSELLKFYKTEFNFRL